MVLSNDCGLTVFCLVLLILSANKPGYFKDFPSLNFGAGAAGGPACDSQLSEYVGAFKTMVIRQVEARG